MSSSCYVGITDSGWFNFLRTLPNVDEINFWQPRGNNQFRALKPGELFLFKLHNPQNYIVGGGFFAHASLLPISLAWEAFGQKNGAESFLQMRKHVAKYRDEEASTSDFQIGCILLEQPFFLHPDLWVPVPQDWKLNIVSGKKYDLEKDPMASIWMQIKAGLGMSPFIQDQTERYGVPQIVYPRLGQGSFRVMVTDAYQRRCAITNERTLPALDAAHIKPFFEMGANVINNGILLRRDLHALFDSGYITITPELRIEVSKKIKEEYENGHDYYRHHGHQIQLPVDKSSYPSQEYLEWHNTNIYRG